MQGGTQVACRYLSRFASAASMWAASTQANPLFDLKHLIARTEMHGTRPTRWGSPFWLGSNECCKWVQAGKYPVFNGLRVSTVLGLWSSKSGVAQVLSDACLIKINVSVWVVCIACLWYGVPDAFPRRQQFVAYETTRNCCKQLLLLRLPLGSVYSLPSCELLKPCMGKTAECISMKPSNPMPRELLLWLDLSFHGKDVALDALFVHAPTSSTRLSCCQAGLHQWHSLQCPRHDNWLHPHTYQGGTEQMKCTSNTKTKL